MQSPQVTVEPPSVNVTVEATKPSGKRTIEFGDGRTATVTDGKRIEFEDGRTAEVFEDEDG